MLPTASFAGRQAIRGHRRRFQLFQDDVFQTQAGRLDVDAEATFLVGVVAERQQDVAIDRELQIASQADHRDRPRPRIALPIGGL